MKFVDDDDDDRYLSTITTSVLPDTSVVTAVLLAAEYITQTISQLNQLVCMMGGPCSPVVCQSYLKSGCLQAPETEQHLTSHHTHYRSYHGRVVMGQMILSTMSKH